MIPNHKQFIEAIHARKQVCVRFYSKADTGIMDLVCAPMDYGAVGEAQDGVNRYQFWDHTSNNGSHMLVLLPEQILDLRALGTVFDPAEFAVPAQGWKIPRAWVLPLERVTESGRGQTRRRSESETAQPASGGLYGPPIKTK